ncbi:MAG TPA: hypothetical protein PLN55_09905 [Burkholderiaceae bacterium]|nr:hypothetical protein [Burkholderiaceae bacterium]
MATADPFASLRAQSVTVVAGEPFSRGDLVVLDSAGRAIRALSVSAEQAARALAAFGTAARVVDVQTQAELRLASERSGLLRRFKLRTLAKRRR